MTQDSEIHPVEQDSRTQEQEKEAARLDSLRYETCVRNSIIDGYFPHPTLEDFEEDVPQRIMRNDEWLTRIQELDQPTPEIQQMIRYLKSVT